MGQLIDWHTHCWLPEHRSKDDADLWKLRGVAGTGKADPDAHQTAIEEAGAEKFVVVAIPRRGAMCTPNEFIAEYVGRFPGRAVGLSSVDPEDPGAADELEHAITTLGLKGVKLSPVYQSMDPRSANCYKLYEIA